MDRLCVELRKPVPISNVNFQSWNCFNIAEFFCHNLYEYSQLNFTNARVRVGSCLLHVVLLLAVYSSDWDEVWRVFYQRAAAQVRCCSNCKQTTARLNGIGDHSAAGILMFSLYIIGDARQVAFPLPPSLNQPHSPVPRSTARRRLAAPGDAALPPRGKHRFREGADERRGRSSPRSGTGITSRPLWISAW